MFITILTGELRSQEELDGLFEVMDLVQQPFAPLVGRLDAVSNHPMRSLLQRRSFTGRMRCTPLTTNS